MQGRNHLDSEATKAKKLVPDRTVLFQIKFVDCVKLFQLFDVDIKLFSCFEYWTLTLLLFLDFKFAACSHDYFCKA